MNQLYNNSANQWYSYSFKMTTLTEEKLHPTAQDMSGDIFPSPILSQETAQSDNYRTDYSNEILKGNFKYDKIANDVSLRRPRWSSMTVDQHMEPIYFRHGPLWINGTFQPYTATFKVTLFYQIEFVCKKPFQVVPAQSSLDTVFPGVSFEEYNAAGDFLSEVVNLNSPFNWNPDGTLPNAIAIQPQYIRWFHARFAIYYNTHTKRPTDEEPKKKKTKLHLVDEFAL